ncbi:MAG TPA: hypothetical protein VMA98_02620 [Candidatus Acidoferrales bacterium]|nr:hypothetical protein [Candidatus Acidoferrales bacterium]
MKSRAPLNVAGALLTALAFLMSNAGITLAQTPTPSPAPSPAPTSTAAQFSCRTSDLDDVASVYFGSPSPQEAKASPPIPATAQNYLEKELAGRLEACRSRLSPASRKGACEVAKGEGDNPSELWAHLKFCEALLQPESLKEVTIPWNLAVTATPTPAPGTTARPVPASTPQPVIFVLGVAAPSDTATISKLVSTLAVYLTDGEDESGYRFTDDAIIIPEPTWTTDYYATMCENSESVRGAIIVSLTAAGSGSSDQFYRRRNWAAVEATAAYAQCANRAPSVTWISNIEQQDDQRYTFTPLLPLALLLSLAAMYEEFTPSRTNSTVTTTVFPSPKAIPSTGYQTQQQATNSKTFNGAQFGSVAGGFLGSAITYTNAAAPLSAPTVDQQTWDLLQGLAMKLIGDMNCWQPVPEAIGPPNAADIIGPPRALPGYNPPAGLGKYLSGRASAPFCGEPGTTESIKDLLMGGP